MCYSCVTSCMILSRIHSVVTVCIVVVANNMWLYGVPDYMYHGWQRSKNKKQDACNAYACGDMGISFTLQTLVSVYLV